MGALTRMKAWLNNWINVRVATYPAWVESFADEIYRVVPGLTIGTTEIANPLDPPQNQYYIPAGGVTGEKDGELYLSSDLAPAQVWIWYNGAWSGLSAGAGSGATSIAVRFKYEDDVDDAGLYREITGSPFPSAIIWWTDGTKTVKVKEILITRNGSQNPTTVVYKFYDNGVLAKTYTDTILYSGVFETSRTRSIT